MKRFSMFMALLLVVFGVTATVVYLQRLDVTIEARRVEAEARRAEAEAARLQAELDLTQAQAQIETAQGERAVLEAAARSVDADRRLVTWYTLRGDLRGLLAFIGALGLALCGGVIVILVKGWQDAKNANHE